MTLSTKIFTITFIIYLLSFILLGSPFIFGDGYGYFHVAENLSEDLSFVSENEPSYIEYSGHAVSKFNEKFVTVYPTGPALVWTPFLLFDNDNLNETNDYFKSFNGHSLYEGFVPLVSSFILSFLSLILIYKILRYLNFSEKISLIALFTVFLSSFALGYVITNSAYSHTYEIFFLSGLLYFVTKYGKNFEKQNLFWAGVFAGLLVLTRSTAIVILIGVLVYILKLKNFKKLGLFVLGGLLFLFIYLLYNKLSYDHYLANSYDLVWNQNFDFSNFYLLEILFSDVRGWFIWSPVMFFGLIGILWYAYKSSIGFMMYIFPVLTTILLYSFWPVWWAGDSIGQRFFLILVPFMVIGLAHLLRKAQNFNKKIFFTLLFLFFTLTTYSFSLLMLHRFSPTDQLVILREPQDDSPKYHYIPSSERFSASVIYKYHFDLLKTAQSPSAYFDSLTESLNGGRSLTMLYLGYTKPVVKPEYRNNGIQNKQYRELLIHIVPDPVKHKKSVDVNLSVIEKGQVVKRLVLPISDTSKNQTFNFECLPENCELKIDNLNVVEFSPETEISLNQRHLIEIDADTQVEIAVNEGVKLIDK